MDLIFIGALVLSGLIGAVRGFGRVLRSLAKHLPGKIAAVFFTYFIFGTVLNFGFVQDLLTRFVNMIVGWNNIGGKLLLIFRIDMIVFAVVLFIAVRLLQRLAVSLVAAVMEAKAPFMHVLNSFGGLLLSMASIFIIFLVFFQIVAWTTGIYGPFYEYLLGSAIGLDKLFVHNPVNAITDMMNLSLLGLK